MTHADDNYLRNLRERRGRGVAVAEPEGEPSPTPVPTTEPLVAQGVRVRAAPPPRGTSPDEYLREGLGGPRWTRIV